MSVEVEEDRVQVKIPYGSARTKPHKQNQVYPESTVKELKFKSLVVVPRKGRGTKATHGGV